MDNHTYKKIEVVGTSNKSIEEAISSAIKRANTSLKHLRWFEVDEVRGAIKDGQISEWQVGLKIAFTLDESKS